MTPYEKQLREAIKQSAGKGTQRPPERTLKYIATLNDPLTEAFCSQIGHPLFSTLQGEFEYLKQAQGLNISLTVSQYAELVGLIRWLLDELKNIKSLESSGGMLLACFTVSRFIGVGRILWQDIILPKKQYAVLFQALGKLLGSCQCGFSSRGLTVPLYEQEMVDSFQEADKNENFIGMDHALKPLMDILVPHFLLDEATLCLAYNDFKTLSEISSKISQLVSVLWIVDPLSNTLRFRLAVECSSNRVRFAALYQTLNDRRKKQRSFGVTNHKLLSALLVKVANDSKVWRQFMSVFNKYPVRYPAFQLALGEALARVSTSHCIEYVDAIDVGSANGTKEVAACLHRFRSYATSKLQRVLFEKCFQEWNKFMEMKHRESNRFDLVHTEIDYGVVAFMTECVGYEEIAARITSLEAEFSNLHLQWHASETELTSAYYTVLSRLQLYTHAKRIMEFGGDYSLAKGYLPPSVFANRYFSRINRNLSQRVSRLQIKHA